MTRWAERHLKDRTRPRPRVKTLSETICKILSDCTLTQQPHQSRQQPEWHTWFTNILNSSTFLPGTWTPVPHLLRWGAGRRGRKEQRVRVLDKRYDIDVNSLVKSGQIPSLEEVRVLWLKTDNNNNSQFYLWKHICLFACWYYVTSLLQWRKKRI